MIHDDRRCELGEGPLWHPEREQLFWFDILNRRLMTREGPRARAWEFPGMVSAAGWVDRDTLIVASETGFLRLDLTTGATERLADLEADRPDTRSNDGRADPFGGFWVGTMGKRAEDRAGAIWRYFRGEVRRLFPGITIPNAIAFTPDGTRATFADTRAGIVWQVRLGRDGWPEGDPAPFLDLRGQDCGADGAVFDADGRFWLAEWGAARVSCHENGQRVETLSFPAPHTSCPAFGGPDLSTLFITSALEGMDDAARAAHPQSGMTFRAETRARGQAEHRVAL